MCRLLPLYFPRDKFEEEVAVSKLPADVGDENGETVIDERKIRIKPLPVLSPDNAPVAEIASTDSSFVDIGLARRRSKHNQAIVLFTLVFF
jgi:hypothetical protein